MQNFFKKIMDFLKSEKGKEAMNVLIIILVGVTSFYLGRLSISEPIKTENDKATTTSAIYSDTKTENKIKNNSQTYNNSDTTSPDTTKKGSYVASQNGTKYYALSCATANRIKEENRVYFDSTTQAENAGYSKSSTCKDY